MPSRRRTRLARAAAARRASTPVVPDLGDDDVADAADESHVSSPPAPEPAEEDDDDAEAEVEAEEVATPARDSDVPDDIGSTSPMVEQFPRRRRPGRPPKNRPPDWDDEVERTPYRRKRGRPSGGGFRGRGRGGAASRASLSDTTRVAVDKEGTMMDVVNDEVALPEDPEGETKVDKNGYLQDGRDYRVRVFTVTGRGKRLYMLSTEPARCTGFRDSYLFFTKHMQLHKIIIDDDEKRDLIERELIPHSYKGRAIGVVTARSVFREFGSRIVVGGRKITDDYNVQAARERGDIEGELADPYDRLPGPGETYNKNQYVAWHGASAVYHQAQGGAPVPQGKVVTGKRRLNITQGNWQYEHAKDASRFNSSLAALRKQNLNGVYDPHTNLMHYSKIMQPTHARWEQVEAPNDENDATANHDANDQDVTMTTNGHATNDDLTRFSSKVPSVISRNYVVVDTVFQSPPHAGLGIPGPDGNFVDVGPNGLPELTAEMRALMPVDCLKAFDAAKGAEKKWKDSWGSEARDGARGKLNVGLIGHPV